MCQKEPRMESQTKKSSAIVVPKGNDISVDRAIDPEESGSTPERCEPLIRSPAETAWAKTNQHQDYKNARLLPSVRDKEASLTTISYSCERYTSHA